MKSHRLDRTARQSEVRDEQDQSKVRSRYTTSWGWFTVPAFGSAGSGGLELEPVAEPQRKAA